MLELLFLRNNSFGGSIHMPLYRNFQLAQLEISSNHLVGTIPQDIGKLLAGISYLNLSHNALSGSIPSSFANMGAINILELAYNNLSGEVPQELFKESAISVLKLSHNNLQGKVLSGNFSLYWFNMLLLDSNNFTGEISNNKSFDISVLDISNNSFSGMLPNGMVNSYDGVSLSVKNNMFEGVFPCGIATFTNLDISHNFFSGTIPTCLNLDYMEKLHLGSNKFTGSIPKTFLNANSLLTLDLGSNYLSGKIPKFLGDLVFLRILILRDNNFSGSIPKQLCKLTSASLIDLSGNSLSSSIPHCLKNIAAPYYLSDYIQTNSINSYPWYSSFEYSGAQKIWRSLTDDNPLFETPDEVEFTTKSMSRSYKGHILDFLSGLDLSSNKLTGEIPLELGYLTEILALNLSHNQLMGSIPKKLSNLTNIESLDLSSNNLSGNIPSQLTNLAYLSHFNVSYNNLTGKLPDMKGQFGTFTAASYKGNPLLCGPPLEKTCASTSPVTTPPGDGTSAKEDEKWYDIDTLWFFSSLSATLAVYLLGFAAILYSNPGWRRWWLFFIEENAPQLLATLAQKLKWVRDTTAKLNIFPTRELLKFDLPAPKKKQPAQGDSKNRKRINFEKLFLRVEPKDIKMNSHIAKEFSARIHWVIETKDDYEE
ncbi:receptor like protein 1 [Tanacetum coccineum]